MNWIVLVTPTTPDARMKQLVNDADGFIYCVSHEGVTGVRDSIAAGARRLVEKIKTHTRGRRQCHCQPVS